MQWFIWLGKGFREQSLIFGSASSAGIFDKIAKLVLFVVAKRAQFPKENIIQHLDDVVAVDTENAKKLEIFDETFKEVAEKIGVKLAPRDDPDKSFGPSTEGCVLGVMYNTQQWTWGINKEKMARIRNDIEDIIMKEEVDQERIWSIAGKIINIRSLVPGGKFHVDHIIRANHISDKRKYKVSIDEELRRQLKFWQIILPVCSNNINIPRLKVSLNPWALQAFTDASGGSMASFGYGVGVVTKDWWSYICWGDRINSGQFTEDNKRLDRCMSVLELVGPLMVVVAGYDWCRNKQVKSFVDNQAAVNNWEKGYSYHSKLATTVVKAIDMVAAALQCKVDIVKITRCVNAYATTADYISKGKFAEFKKIAKEEKLDLPVEWEPVPKALLKWIARPECDDLLGHKILLEMMEYTKILSNNC